MSAARRANPNSSFSLILLILVHTLLPTLRSHSFTMVHFTIATIAAMVGFLAQAALAIPSPTTNAEGVYVKRAASCTFPTPPKTSSLSAAKTITGTFDGELPMASHNCNVKPTYLARWQRSLRPRFRCLQWTDRRWRQGRRLHS
jgi:hypothetical protein